LKCPTHVRMQAYRPTERTTVAIHQIIMRPFFCHVRAFCQKNLEYQNSCKCFSEAMCATCLSSEGHSATWTSS